MIIDGRAIARDIHTKLQSAVADLPHPPMLSVIAVEPSPAIEQFIRVKKRVAEKIGIQLAVHQFSDETQEEVEKRVHALAEESNRGVVVQLPLPARFDEQAVLDAVPQEKDPDMLSTAARQQFHEGKSRIVPPVVGAIAEILKREDIAVSGRRVVIIGRGRLVGAPAETWFLQNGAEAVVADEETKNLTELTRSADIIVSGAGSPGLLTPGMVQDGVVLFDAGTSTDKGKVAGDIAPECAQKAALYTPVPGGIGPITVAKLFENLVVLCA